MNHWRQAYFEKALIDEIHLHFLSFLNAQEMTQVAEIPRL